MVVRFVLLKYVPAVVFSGYAYIFAIAYALVWLIAGHHKLALFCGLGVVLGRTVWRNMAPEKAVSDMNGPMNACAFAFGIVAIMAIANILSPSSQLVHYGLIAFSAYVALSVTEWLAMKRRNRLFPGADSWMEPFLH